jgi:phospholipase C
LKKTIGHQASGSTEETIIINLLKSGGWYDFTLRIPGNKSFEKRYAGHVETGSDSKSDPAMGKML